MARINPMDILYGYKKNTVSPADFMFDNLVAPPLLSLLTIQDIAALNYIATSLKYSGAIEKKYKAMDAVLYPRGFRKLATGTNRRAYTHPEFKIILKVALDSVGISDSPREYQNQFLIKPFCTKVFEVSPCGTVALVERVNPITSKAEFLSVAEDIFHLINKKIIGQYVLEDIGTKFFMNWGLREGGFGPVLLDFPYVYELDGSKLRCNALIPENNFLPCGGSVDYDDGFNKLVCTKCDREYSAREISQPAKQGGHSNIIIEKDIEEEFPVIIQIKKNGEVIRQSEPESERIVIPERKVDHVPKRTGLRRNEELVRTVESDILGTIIIKKKVKPNKNNNNRNNNRNQNNPKPEEQVEDIYKHGIPTAVVHKEVVEDEPVEEEVIDNEYVEEPINSEEPDDVEAGVEETDPNEEYISEELNIKESDFNEPADEDESTDTNEYADKYSHLIPADEEAPTREKIIKKNNNDYY